MRILLVSLFLLAAACSSPDEASDAGVADAGPFEDAAMELPDTTSGPDTNARTDTGASEGDVGTDDAGELADFAAPPGCNGSDDYCAKRLDEYTFATTHNANNNRDQGGLIPNQTHSLTRQLRDGVRGFMLDVWDDDGETAMCHGNCRLGSRPLVDGLAEIDRFIERYPGTVVVILFEAHVDAPRFAAAFDAANISERVAVLDPEAPLPTLGELDGAGTPWVVFSQRDGGDPTWYHPMWDWLWDTDYSAESLTDFSCDRLRGQTDNPLFLVNHFLTNPVASESLARGANEETFLRERVLTCWRESGDRPNFIAVDFYEFGGLFEVVDELNGLDAPP